MVFIIVDHALSHSPFTVSNCYYRTTRTEEIKKKSEINASQNKDVFIEINMNRLNPSMSHDFQNTLHILAYLYLTIIYTR
jgi:hypothetical protein